MESSYPDYYENLRKLSGKLTRELRSPMSAFFQLTGAARADGALNGKTKQLIALGIGSRCDATAA